MVDDAFEARIESLFDEAPTFEDAEAFGDAIKERVARIRRAGRLVHGLAWTTGGSIALLQLAQPSFWAWLAGVAGKGGEAVDGAVRASAASWSAPTPMFCAAVLGGALLVAYVTSLLREN